MKPLFITIAALLLPLAADGSDPATPRELAADLDGDGRPEKVVVDASGTLRVIDQGGAEWGAIKAPAGSGAVGGATIEVVRAGDHEYVHARIALPADPRGRFLEEVALVEGRGLQEVASFVAGPQGPDGEWSVALRAGAEGLLRYQTASRIVRCDGFNLIFPELYDVATRRFRPVSIAPLGATAASASLEATLSLPTLAREAPLGLFRFTAASSQRGESRRADRLTPPRELDDGRLDTAWWEGAQGSGRGAFVTARSIAGEQRLDGIAIATAPGNLLLGVALFVGAAPVAVTLDPKAAPGRWQWIPLGGRRADCVTIALDGIARQPPGDDTGLAEVRIYTDSDGPGAVARLVKRAGDSGSEALLPILTEHAREVASELPGAPPASRSILLRALSSSTSPEAAKALVGALPAASPDERALIAGALVDGGPLAGAARDPLARLAGDGSVPAAARRSAIELLAAGPAGATIWSDLERGAFDDDAELREAALRALDKQPVAAALAVVTAAPTSGAHSDDARAALLGPYRVRALGRIAARSRAAGDQISRELAVQSLERLAISSDFAARFHWLRAARLAASKRLLPLIDRDSRDADEVLRWAAVDAAAAVETGAGGDIVRRGLADPDPRVRVAGLDGLAAQHDAALVHAAERALSADRWPMVRRAAAEQLGAACPGAASAALARAAAPAALALAATSAALARAATSDRDEAVAIAALSSLARCDAVPAGRLALRMATDPNARAAPREHACALLARLRPPAAAAALSEALMDVLDSPASDERFAGLAAQMARALGKLGDPAGEAGLARALGEPLLPSLRIVALESLATLCTASAKRSIAGATRDDDAAVRRAAMAAAARCH